MSSLAVTKVGGAANNPTSSQEATVGLYSLPEELFVNGIFQFLDGESLAKVSQVCVKMFQMIYNSKFTGGYYSFFVGSKVFETKVYKIVKKFDGENDDYKRSVTFGKRTFRGVAKRMPE